MKNHILLAILFLPAVLLSQKNYAPLGAYWAYEGHSLDCTGFHKTFKVEREVYIDEKDCSVIYSYLSDDLNPEPQPTGDSLIVWEDDNKVYFLEDTSFYLLYDFEAETGDTVVFFIPLNRGPFSKVCIDSLSESPAQFTASIIDVEEINIDGQSKKSFEIEVVSPIYSECISLYLCAIIENIGSTTESITGDYCGHVADGCFGGLVCYENDFVHYETGILPLECDFTSGIQTESEDNEFVIFPNPAKTIVHILTPEQVFIRNIEIFDPGMQLVLHQEAESTIDLRGLDAGMYFIIATLKSGNRITKKVLKL